MTTQLFITAVQVKERTSISSATDKDSILQKIYFAQITDITRILGQELYDKIYTDFNSLAGDYLTIYNRYIVDMHVFYAAHYFVLFNEVKPSNVGNTVMSTEFGRPSDKTTMESEKYKSLGISVEDNFRRYMEKSNIPEWNYCKKSEETTNFNDFY